MADDFDDRPYKIGLFSTMAEKWKSKIITETDNKSELFLNMTNYRLKIRRLENNACWIQEKTGQFWIDVFHLH